MPVYTVESPEGRRVKFEWTGAEPPTDVDMEEVFAAAGGGIAPTPVAPQPVAPQKIPADIQQFSAAMERGEDIGISPEAPALDTTRAIQPPSRRELSPEEEAQIATSTQEGYRILGAAAYNTPASAFQFVKDVTAIVRHPIQTAKGIKGLSFGLVELLIPGEQKDEATARAMGQFLKDRYGSMEAILDTFENDPVGFFADVSVLFTAGGALASKAGRLSTLGKNIQTFGRTIDPVSGLGLAVNKLATARTPINSLVKTALSLPKKIDFFRIDDLANAFLDKGLNVTRKSLQILDNDIKKVQKAINKIVDKRTKQGIQINGIDIANALDALMDDAAREGLKLRDLRTVKRMRNEFIEQHGEILTPRQVQNIKIGFNKGFKPNLETRAGQVQAKIDNTLREASKLQLEELHPALKALNADEGVMLELTKAIQERLKTIEKRDIIPTKGLVVGGIAGGVAGATGGLAAGIGFGITALVVGEIVSSPKVQVSVARAIHKANLRAARAGKLSVVTRPAFQAGRLGRVAELEGAPSLELEGQLQ